MPPAIVGFARARTGTPRSRGFTPARLAVDYFSRDLVASLLGA